MEHRAESNQTATHEVDLLTNNAHQSVLRATLTLFPEETHRLHLLLGRLRSEKNLTDLVCDIFGHGFAALERIAEAHGAAGDGPAGTVLRPPLEVQTSEEPEGRGL